MLSTFILQYLNKLVEGEVRHFTPPKSFHTLKVQGFKDNRIKLLTEFRGELPVKVFALITHPSIETCEFPHTPPPTVRTFLFTTQFFVERPKFGQGVFQRLRVLYVLTRAKCQVSVFHAEVCPYALTCSGQRSKICVSCCDTKPVISTVITLDCDTTNSPMPLTVFMESIRHVIKLPLTCFWIPFTQCESDTIIFQRPASLPWVSNRLKLMSFFDFRSATQLIEKTLVCFMNTFQFLLDSLRRQRLPM